eukprot:CAMPEP_0198255540 /NCGR_PEP_ID=MMETSP1447-20131203/5641_1 /TAXON_ID=420782 /ORGANISM="Chaetoceros dichaeta, Strain CCMP1751" /LENGTH=58 /DNA_ID=CAMNT_0043941931 /DNA_START=144 /DNA_END=317 /DNA_ORIENTATION=-
MTTGPNPFGLGRAVRPDGVRIVVTPPGPCDMRPFRGGERTNDPGGGGPPRKINTGAVV